jgi:acetyl-CoA C-acetyltransferase
VTHAVYVTACQRTAIGGFGGSLSTVPPAELASTVIRHVLENSAVEASAIGHVVLGNVIPTGPEDAYLARVAAINAGIPSATPALTVNRLCGSGVQAIVSAAQCIMLGDCDIALAGGAETMSLAPHLLRKARFGHKMGDLAGVDVLTGVLTDPFGHGMMGITAENVAAQWGISREEQDAFALESQRRAGRAAAAGHFAGQIVPVTVRKGSKEFVFDTDEHAKPQTTADALAGLRPTFKKDGTVTPGNASGINDAASIVMLMSEAELKRRGTAPMGRIVGYAHSGVDPSIMGIGPIPAVKSLLKRTGLSIDDFDVVESNEAFAAQAIAVNRDLGLDPARVNPDGGAIALGHPVGATGAILVTKALHYLKRTGGKRALVTMCIGGGQGIALALEAAT